MTSDVVHHQLSIALRPTLGELHTAALGTIEHDPEVELLAAGHCISDADLHLAYGLDVVGGIAATLDSLTTHFTVVFERTLSRPVRNATAQLAHHTIADLPGQASAELLIDTGWRPTPFGRWQLLIIQ